MIILDDSYSKSHYCPDEGLTSSYHCYSHVSDDSLYHVDLSSNDSMASDNSSPICGLPYPMSLTCICDEIVYCHVFCGTKIDPSHRHLTGKAQLQIGESLLSHYYSFYAYYGGVSAIDAHDGGLCVTFPSCCGCNYGSGFDSFAGLCNPHSHWRTSFGLLPNLNSLSNYSYYWDGRLSDLNGESHDEYCCVSYTFMSAKETYQL